MKAGVDGRLCSTPRCNSRKDASRRCCLRLCLRPAAISDTHLQRPRPRARSRPARRFTCTTQRDCSHGRGGSGPDAGAAAVPDADAAPRHGHALRPLPLVPAAQRRPALEPRGRRPLQGPGAGRPVCQRRMAVLSRIPAQARVPQRDPPRHRHVCHRSYGRRRPLRSLLPRRGLDHLLAPHPSAPAAAANTRWAAIKQLLRLFKTGYVCLHYLSRGFGFGSSLLHDHVLPWTAGALPTQFGCTYGYTVVAAWWPATVVGYICFMSVINAIVKLAKGGQRRAATRRLLAGRRWLPLRAHAPRSALHCVHAAFNTASSRRCLHLPAFQMQTKTRRTSRA